MTAVNRESARLLSALNDAAAGTRRGSAARSPGRSTRCSTGPCARVTGRDRAAGPLRLVAFTVAAAEGWRQQRTEAIEEGLARVDVRLTADLRARLDVLRDSAAELLGRSPAVPDPGGRLAESRRFFDNTAEDVGQTELLAGAVRRWLPGEFGRRTAREHLRREAPGLVDSQIGRAQGTCSTGSRRRRGRWCGWWSSATPTAPTATRSALRAAADLRERS